MSTKVNQKEAVYNAVSSLGEVIPGQKVELTKAAKESVLDALVQGFEDDEIELSSKQDDIRKYSVGLLNNWLRKDTRLNGGDRYEAKNPGSRSGSGDDMVKNLRLMLKTEVSAAQKVIIEAAIASRIAVIKPTKVVEVDYSKIPDDIKKALGIE